MKGFFRKIVRKLKGVFEKTADSSEEIINKYEKTVIQAEWSASQKLNYSLKNYAKDFSEMEDFSQFSSKLWELSVSNERPLLVMIMGEFKTGKSTFINAILGREVLKSDVTPATAVVTMIAYGEKEKILAHFHSGESKEYTIDMLDKLTAEGDESKQSLRSSIKYVELQLPLELLREITLIDTPGLNVDNELHIKATKQFMHEADLILWVFAYGKTASKTELLSISELGERLKPIAIVNRIDEIDEEEESLEDVLSEIRRRLKNSVKDIYGVSSYLANKGIQEEDQELLRESGWTEFLAMFDSQIVNQAEILKQEALIKKSEEVVYVLSDYVQKLQKELDHLFEKYNNKARFEKETEKTIHLLEESIVKISDLVENRLYIDARYLRNLIEKDDANMYKTAYYSIGLKSLKGIAHKLSDSEMILKNINIYEQVNKDAEMQFKKIESEFEMHVKKIDRHNADIELYDKDVEIYSNSGFFGGTPLFDWDGTKKQLEQRRINLNRQLAQLNNLRSNLIGKWDVLISRVARQNKEQRDYLTKIVKPIKKDIVKYQADLNTLNLNNSEGVEKLNKRYKELKQAQEIFSSLNFVNGNRADKKGIASDGLSKQKKKNKAISKKQPNSKKGNTHPIEEEQNRLDLQVDKNSIKGHVNKLEEVQELETNTPCYTSLEEKEELEEALSILKGVQVLKGGKEFEDGSFEGGIETFNEKVTKVIIGEKEFTSIEGALEQGNMESDTEQWLTRLIEEFKSIHQYKAEKERDNLSSAYHLIASGNKFANSSLEEKVKMLRK